MDSIAALECEHPGGMQRQERKEEGAPGARFRAAVACAEHGLKGVSRFPVATDCHCVAFHKIGTDLPQ